MLHTSGVVPVRPDGTVPTAIGEQAAGGVGEHRRRSCAEAGMTADDVVSVTTYVVVDELGRSAR